MYAFSIFNGPKVGGLRDIFVMAKCGIRKEKFSLHHTNVDRFHSSHWSSTGKQDYKLSIISIGNPEETAYVV